ncbi:ferritin-3, chloroplastic-like [Ostrinia furnacalis]|uniref:ferritin-3, chloroplastic-like n=1 Tax=Ostrinia furnacalis TaxID=93504 RepID=UPI00103F67AC|nr:ferritin-3, chloroplastic-like [Ostrinia furnacalis]
MVTWPTRCNDTIFICMFIKIILVNTMGSFLKTANIFSCCKPYLHGTYCINMNVILNSFRRHSNCKFKYSPEVEAAINKQIQSEQNAAFSYLNMATIFLHPTISYPGVGGFFMKMYEEELHHMKILINYQIIRGGIPILNFGVVDPVDPNMTLVEAFNLALEKEKKVTEELKNIVNTAEASEDYQSVELITSKFLLEQAYAMNDLSHYITKLKRLCDDKDALYQFDLKLGQLYPYSLKI